MAAPPEKSVDNLNGRWLLNKDISDSADTLMILQGVSWLLRKGIGLANITIHIDHQGSNDTSVIVLKNTANFGVKGTTEVRTLDWNWASHKDHIWGEVQGRNRIVRAAEVSRDSVIMGLLQSFEMALQDMVYSEAEAIDGSWKSQMLWGFETIKGQRRFVRNTRVLRGEAEAYARLIYDFLP